MIQILRQRIFEEGGRAVFVYTEPPILLPNLATLFKQYNQFLTKYLPKEEHVNLFYTVAHHTGTAHSQKPVRTKSSFEYQTTIPFDLDGADVSRPLDYAARVGQILEAPLETLSVVVSGNGIHLLAGLRNPIRSAGWFDENRQAYGEICRKINESLREGALPGSADPSCFEPARVLRLPGTRNEKPGKAATECQLVYYSDAALDLDLQKLSGLTAASQENVSPGEIRRKYPTPDFAEMVKECRFVRWAIEKPGEVHEPQAFDLFSLLAPQPRDAVVTIGESEYTPRSLADRVFNQASASASLKRADFDNKWEQAKLYGGRKCTTIQDHWLGGCESCPHFGKIPTPLALKSPEHIGSEALGYWVLNAKGAPMHPHYEDLAKVYGGEAPYIVTPDERFMAFNGYYRETQPLVVKAWVDKKVKPTEPLREAHRNEFFNRVKAYRSISEEEQDHLFVKSILGKLNCKNGILDVETGRMLPSNPAIGFKYILPYDYHPGLVSEAFLDWLALVLLDRTELMDAILDLMAYVLWPTYDDHLFAYFVGDGANGKSTLLDVIRALVGRFNFSAVSLQQLGTNRFAPASLEGKLVNISGESSDREMGIAEMNMIKELSAGEVTQVERKGQDSFSFKNLAKLIFSANKPPKFQESGHALKRRMLVIPFDYRIETPDSRIQTQLIQEVPAIMSMLVKRIQVNTLANGGRFLVSRGGREAADAQKKVLTQGNTVLEWARECVESSVDVPTYSTIPVSDAYVHYLDWAQRNGIKNTKNKVWFGRDMVEFVVTNACEEKCSQMKVGNKNVRVYHRMRFKEHVE